MNFLQLHERLRLEITRRIDRGLLTGTLLAQQTGLRPSHISNFLHRKRRLSLTALDRVLSAQLFSVDDLMPGNYTREPAIRGSGKEDLDSVPLVADFTAISSPSVSNRSTLEIIHLPAGLLEQMRPRRTFIRRDWQRFLAVRVSSAQALPMSPVLREHAVIVLDRHYNSLAPYRPPLPNLYGVAIGNTLSFRYVSSQANQIILRPHVLEYPVELLEILDNESPSTCIVGRVCVCLAEI